MRRGEDLEAHRRLQALLGSEASRYQVLRPENPLPVADGVVVGMGLHDELSGDMFAAVRTAIGQGYYLRLPLPMSETLQEGDTVRAGFELECWLKPADRIVARFARENGGMYDPIGHQRALEELPQGSRQQGQPSPADRVAANVRRLERLARYRLAERLPDGRWRIPADLLTQLQSREGTHPQRRFRFEKLVGSTRVLVRPKAPDAVSEQEALARALGKQLGLTYVAELSEFRGRLTMCARTPGGGEYVCIADYRRGQFTVVPKPAAADRLAGRTVLLTRDGQGRLSLEIVREISR